MLKVYQELLKAKHKKNKKGLSLIVLFFSKLEHIHFGGRNEKENIKYFITRGYAGIYAGRMSKE